jgi:3-oxoacyl-[acyl-carrier protein] reductase
MNLDLSGKNALVCGSTQGIGKAIAIQLAQQGANVILVARNQEKLKVTLNDLPNSAAQKHDYIQADFSQSEQLRLVLEEYLNRTKIRIHILINNTGGPAGGPIAKAKTEEFKAAFEQHLLCNHILAQACIEGMAADGFGRIINIISTSVKQPLKGLGVSNTIRAAVANWSKTLSLEVAPKGITVNNVLPGATETIRIKQLLDAKSAKEGKSIEELRNEMQHEIPMGRFADAAEIANAVGFLSSPAASYITGINLPVDGGRTGCL